MDPNSPPPDDAEPMPSEPGLLWTKGRLAGVSPQIAEAIAYLFGDATPAAHKGDVREIRLRPGARGDVYLFSAGYRPKGEREA